MHRRHFLSLNLACLAGLTTVYANSDQAVEQAIAKGKQFLVDLLDPELDLLPEFQGSKTYWLFHDNYLAAKVLKKSHPTIAAKIDAALKREKVTTSGKIEILFDRTGTLSANYHYELVEVRKAGEKILKTERQTKKINKNWDDYADLRFFAGIGERFCGVYGHACVQDGFKLWDGKGFVDPATKKDNRYATYKLALAKIAAARYGIDNQVIASLLPLLLKLQAPSGGWITDYDANLKPIGQANVETTCLCILALEGL